MEIDIWAICVVLVPTPDVGAIVFATDPCRWTDANDGDADA